MYEDTIGVDVSKDRLDAHRLSDGAEASFTNDEPGIAALIRWAGPHCAARVAFEPTCPYHRRLERVLAMAGLAFVKVNPRHARRFVEALGAKAKTDRADAAMLARMAAALHLRKCAAGWARGGRWARRHCCCA